MIKQRVQVDVEVLPPLLLVNGHNGQRQRQQKKKVDCAVRTKLQLLQAVVKSEAYSLQLIAVHVHTL